MDLMSRAATLQRKLVLRTEEAAGLRLQLEVGELGTWVAAL